MIVPELPQPGTRRIPAVPRVRAREARPLCRRLQQYALSLSGALWDRNIRDQNRYSILSSIRPAYGSALRLWRKACRSCAQERMLDRVGREKGCSFWVESSKAEDITRAESMRVQQCSPSTAGTKAFSAPNWSAEPPP